MLTLADGSESEIDCRPSDAIAVAVRGGQLVQGKDGEEHWFSSLQEAEEFARQEGDTAAVRSKVPIFVEDRVLERAGVVVDGSVEEEGSEGSPRRRPRPARQGVTEEEMEKLSAFSEFLEDLPGLEDLGKPGETQ